MKSNQKKKKKVSTIRLHNSFTDMSIYNAKVTSKSAFTIAFTQRNHSRTHDTCTDNVWYVSN